MKIFCREIITPSDELKRYNKCLIILFIIFIFLFIFDYYDYYCIHVDKGYFIVFIIIVLFLTIFTKYYQFAKLCSFTIILSLINIFINVGLLLQNDTIINNKNKLFYLIYSIIVHLLTLYVLFEAYKEMKAIFMEEYENSDNENDIELTEHKNENNDV